MLCWHKTISASYLWAEQEGSKDGFGVHGSRWFREIMGMNRRRLEAEGTDGCRCVEENRAGPGRSGRA